MLHIGITERGDAGLDLSWVNTISSKSVNGAVLITKNITPGFRKAVLQMHNQGFPLIIHAGCTGWGHSFMEPHVPTTESQLYALMQLIDEGFPADHCVVRIDPIIPSDEGIQRVRYVLDMLNAHPEYFKNIRIRMSIIDDYAHVKARFRVAGHDTIYPGNTMFPNSQLCRRVSDTLAAYPYTFESCAEPYLFGKNIEARGCISDRDLHIMGFSDEDIASLKAESYQRKQCRCLNCKTELLSQRFRCPHQCLYCFWHDRPKTV